MSVHHFEKSSTLSEGTFLICKCTVQCLTQKNKSHYKLLIKISLPKTKQHLQLYACFPLKAGNDRFNCRRTVSSITWDGENHTSLPSNKTMLVIFSDGPARAQRSTTSSYLHNSFLFQEPLVFVFKQRENYSGVESLYRTFNRQRFLP